MSLQTLAVVERKLGVNITGGWREFPIRLDVGGTLYTTTNRTLAPLAENPVFGPIVQNKDGGLKIDGDCHVIDRDGPLFRYVLYYLRSRTLVVPEGFAEWEGLLGEARHFQLDGLEKLILERFEYRQLVFRKQLPQAVCVNGAVFEAGEERAGAALLPSLPGLRPDASGALVFEGHAVSSVSELVMILLNSYGYVVQHWRDNNVIFLTLRE